MEKMNDRRQLMNAVYQAGFALDEATLYLDTHPCDKRAIEYYNMMKKMYKKAYNDYTTNFGPLSIRDVDVSNEKWNWVKTPWPWEMEGC